jgi:hypothetical protein
MARTTNQTFNAIASKLDFRFNGPNESVAGTQQTRQQITTKKLDLAALSSFRKFAFLLRSSEGFFETLFREVFLPSPRFSSIEITPDRFVARILKKIFKYTKTVININNIVVVVITGRTISLWVKLKA